MQKRYQQAQERLQKVYISHVMKNDPIPAQVTLRQIVNGLYLGSVGAAYNLDTLRSLQITHILTVCDGLPPKFENEFVYKVIPVSDHPNTRIGVHFNDAINFILDALAVNGRVLVHCFAGVSRSATIVIAYLMKQRNLPMQKAIFMVKSKRSCIKPNCGFMTQLRRYNVQIHFA